MRLQTDILHQVTTSLKDAFIERVIKDTLFIAGYSFLLEGKDVSVSVVFVSPEEIQMLNKTYRRKNKVTDVLSFPEYAKKRDVLNDASEVIFLGELIVCYDYIVQASIEDGVSLQQETAYIVSHGILHLLGFRHSEKMFAWQDKVSEIYST